MSDEVRNLIELNHSQVSGGAGIIDTEPRTQPRTKSLKTLES
jgi:hypothetical protein